MVRPLKKVGAEILAVAAVLLTAAPTAVAQDEEIVVVVEDTSEDPRAPSLWRTKLSTDRLRETGGELSEALLAVPGVYVRRFAGVGGPESISLRGTSGQQAKVFFNGVPTHRMGGADLALMPPALLGSVEVYRGGAGARFGSGALGGALVINPEIPTDGFKLTLSTGLATAGTLRLSAGIAGGTELLRGIATAEVLRSEGDFVFEDGQGVVNKRVNADVRRVGALAGVELHPSGKGSLSLTNLAVVSERGQPGPSEFQDALDEARVETLSNTLALVGRRRDLVSTRDLALDAEARLGWHTDHSRYTNPDRLLISAAPYDTSAQQDNFELGAILSGYMARSTIAHLSLEAATERLARRELVETFEDTSERFERDRLAGVFSVEWSWVPASLSLLPAVRVEAVEGLEAQVLPALGASWSSPSQRWTIMANLGRAWRAPSFDELFLKEELVEGDPDLAPEDALSGDVGFVWRPSARLRAEFVAFHIAIDEQILFLPVSATAFRAQNTGRAVSQGLESSFSAAPWSWLGLSASWTVNVARFDAEPRDPLPGRPLHKVAAEIRILRPAVEIFQRVTGRSEVFLDNFGNLKNGPALFVDAGVVARPARGWSVGVVGRNLLDERAALDALQSPLPGLSISAQLSWVYEAE